jgi:hypothetical protein
MQKGRGRPDRPLRGTQTLRHTLARFACTRRSIRTRGRRADEAGESSLLRGVGGDQRSRTEPTSLHADGRYGSRDLSREHLGSWSCPGPGGWRAIFSDEGNVVSILFERPGAGRIRSSPAVWRGAGRIFGDLIEWRVAETGEPFAAIIRTWETTDTGAAQESLRVVAINRTAACEYGRVSARLTNANLRGRALAERAAGHVCHQT